MNFEQQQYTANEDDGRLEPVLFLSNPPSSDMTVQVHITGGSASGVSIIGKNN